MVDSVHLFSFASICGHTIFMVPVLIIGS